MRSTPRVRPSGDQENIRIPSEWKVVRGCRAEPSSGCDPEILDAALRDRVGDAAAIRRELRRVTDLLIDVDQPRARRACERHDHRFQLRCRLGRALDASEVHQLSPIRRKREVPVHIRAVGHGTPGHWSRRAAARPDLHWLRFRGIHVVDPLAIR